MVAAEAPAAAVLMVVLAGAVVAVAGEAPAVAVLLAAVEVAAAAAVTSAVATPPAAVLVVTSAAVRLAVAAEAADLTGRTLPAQVITLMTRARRSVIMSCRLARRRSIPRRPTLTAGAAAASRRTSMTSCMYATAQMPS